MQSRPLNVPPAGPPEAEGVSPELPREELVRLLQEARTARAVAITQQQAMVEFMGRFARELLVPLNAIAGNSRLLQETRLDPIQSQTVRRITEASNELTGPLKDLHQFSTLESGNFKTWPMRVVTRALVKSVTERFEEVAEQRGADFTTDIAPEVPAEVRTDPVVLREVLTHLIDHCLRAAAPRSVEVQVGIRDTDGTDVCLYCTVRTDGPDPAIGRSGDLFSPFAEAWRTLPGAPARSGLGLALAAELIEQLDGAVWFESEPGTGGIFHFALWVERMDPPHTGPGVNMAST